ncbi:MAG: hypothetical protein P8185_02490 [Deltaproteobacteria bacterium]
MDHEFHFTVRHLGDRFAIEAFEIRNGYPGGYEFSAIDDIEGEPFELLEKIIGRMRRALNRRHIYWDETSRNWQITDNDVVRGTIHSDLDSSDYQRLPLMVIDGKDISWSELGRMLMIYEGFNFKLEIFDRTDEIP